MPSRLSRFVLGLWVVLVLAFLFGPIAIIALYAFNAANIQSWPIAGYSLRWFASAWSDREIRAALALSLEAGRPRDGDRGSSSAQPRPSRCIASASGDARRCRS